MYIVHHSGGFLYIVRTFLAQLSGKCCVIFSASAPRRQVDNYAVRSSRRRRRRRVMFSFFARVSLLSRHQFGIALEFI